MKEAKLLSKVKRKLTSKKIHVRLKAKSERLFVSLAWMMDVAFTVCFPLKENLSVVSIPAAVARSIMISNCVFALEN